MNRISIIERIRDVGKFFIGDIHSGARKIPEPPFSFSRNLISTVIQQARRSERIVNSSTTTTNEYRWATEIAIQFNQHLYEDRIYDTLHSGYGQVRISARISETGDLASKAVDLRASIMCLYNPTSSQGEVALRASTAGGIKWTIEITGRPNALTISSEIRLGTYNWPKSTGQLPSRAHAHEAFENYATLVDRIAEGREIAGQIGLRITENPVEDNLHPGVFGICVRCSQDRLKQVLEDCSRVRLAYKLAEKWDVEIYLTNLLDPRVDAATFERSVDLIMERTPGLTHLIGEQLWLSDDKRRQVVIEYNCGRIAINEGFVPRW